MSKNTSNHLSEEEIERLDDRYLTKTTAVTAVGALSATIICFVVYVFTSIASLNTENQLLKQKNEQLERNMVEYNINIGILNKNLEGTNLNLKEVETLLKNQVKK